MNPTAKLAASTVPPEEVARRLAEYRRLGLLRRAPADVVYQPPEDACPWPGCDARIAAIKFQLEKMGSNENLESLLMAWWSGAGLVGKCPGCSNPVLFFHAGKMAISGLAPTTSADLPDNWVQVAHIVNRKP